MATKPTAKKSTLKKAASVTKTTKNKKSASAKNTSKEPLRFAHPFFTTVPQTERTPVPGVGTRMLDYIEKTLLPFPQPRGNATMTLEDVVGKKGAAEIEASQSIIFHAVGDTGHDGGAGQEAVARLMATDYNAAKPETSPAFFLHLGDVIYYDNTDTGYQAQFYSPYKKYPGKIIAIPGNHDGETFITRKDKKTNKDVTTSTGQKHSLDAFVANFCQASPGVPPAAGSIYREMVSQPGVYWYLNAPFVDIIGLYSNMAENPGFIAASKIGNNQKTWLTKTLGTIAKSRTKDKQKKALIIAVHHPPVASGSFGGHSSSTEMLADIDECCTTAEIMPDLFLTGHAHNYQRFTRELSFKGKVIQIPFFIAGVGGRGLQPVAKAHKEKKGQFTFDESFEKYGHLKVSVSLNELKVEVYAVDEKTETRSLFETVTVNLKNNTVSSK